MSCRFSSVFSLAAILLAASASFAAATAIDEIQLGNTSAEQAHQLLSTQSDIITGGLNEPARRLLPLTPVSFDGGFIEFKMKIDPKTQNYLTARLWGSDCGVDSGRLILYANGLQIGYRHEGDYDVLNQIDEEGQAPGRFVYQTVPLPLSLTNGKSEITLKIASLGRMWPYGQTFQQYQKDLTQPSRGIYKVYTHTNPRFVPDPSEKQGNFPQATIRPTPGEEVITQTRQIVIDRLKKLLANPVTSDRATDRKGREYRFALLSEAYNLSWTPAYRDPRVIDQILQDGDATAKAFLNPEILTADNYAGSSWSGAGPLGLAILNVGDLILKHLDQTISLGGKPISRREAWSKTLRMSIDYWRTHRRSYTNQSQIVDWNIYTANRGLQLINPALALPESQTLRYLYESIGLEPWKGADPVAKSDLIADTPDRGVINPYGDSYYLVTRKGISRELGWVGTYGETILHFMSEMVNVTHDEKIRQQLSKIHNARMYFRYPALDADGYRCMKLVSEIDNRTAHYPLKGSAYNVPSIREEWWMTVPAVLHDSPIAVGAALQALEDNQYFAYIDGRLKDPDTLGMMRNIDEYAKVKSLPPAKYRMPGTVGQPDFAFADEQSAVIALKDGDTHLFINLYYRAERSVNSVARIFETTPTLTRLVTAKTHAEAIPSGVTYTRPDWIDGIRSKGLPPAGQVIHQAYAGEITPVSARPAGATEPAYTGWGPFLGKAAYYQLEYGPYLIMMNSSETNDRTVTLPPAFADARDLITGKPAREATSTPMKPLTTIILRATGK